VRVLDRLNNSGDKMASEKKEQNKSAEFLLAEFNALQQRVITREEIKANRVNFLLILTSAVVAGVASMYDANTKNDILLVIIPIASIVLIILGIATFHYTIEDSIYVVYYFRRAGRVRRYFLDKSPDIKDYLPFEANDNSPKYRPGVFFNNSENLVVLLNCLNFTVLIVSALYTIVQIELLIIYGVISFLLLLVLQYLYIRIQLSKAERKYSTSLKFPNANIGENEK
jgi:hypothetical protein